MKILRRQFLHLAGGAFALPVVSRCAWAQSYPARPVRIVVGFPPAGGHDINARLIGQWLSERLGQAFVIQNRPGAAGNIGTETVVRAPADGHTLLLVGTPNAINATLYDNLSFDFLRDIIPIAAISREPVVIVVNSSLPVRTVPEFILYAKSHPGKLNFGSGGVGSVNHVAGELFKMMTGAEITHVPYRGIALALTDLMGGQVQALFPGMASVIEHVRSGKVRALAVTTPTRSEWLPNIPAAAESVPGYEVSQIYGIGAPRNTPAEIVEKLNNLINAGLEDTKLRARLAELGSTPLLTTPAQLKKEFADDTEKWSRVIRAANIKAG